jgi:hypothetical protein
VSSDPAASQVADTMAPIRDRPATSAEATAVLLTEDGLDSGTCEAARPRSPPR